jgi:hypothetical protein
MFEKISDEFAASGHSKICLKVDNRTRLSSSINIIFLVVSQLINVSSMFFYLIPDSSLFNSWLIKSNKVEI